MSQSEYKKQILFIHGGDSFSSHEAYIHDLRTKTLDYERLKPRTRWSNAFEHAYPDSDILMPTMPNSSNARFDEWSILFEKIIPFLTPHATLIGHSLGAMFLAKYLHDTPLSRPVQQLMLVAGGYDHPGHDYGSFALRSASGLEESAKEIHLFHSEDDFVVPYDELAKYTADLPTAHVHSFSDRNHFLDPEFPELLALIK